LLSQSLGLSLFLSRSSVLLDTTDHYYNSRDITSPQVQDKVMECKGTPSMYFGERASTATKMYFLFPTQFLCLQTNMQLDDNENAHT
jgi:hypothetical protein